MAPANATQALRIATRDLHSRIEATPFAKSILDKTLHLDAYVGYVRVLTVIHAALERRLDACDHPQVTRVWSDDLRRLPELLADNDVFRWDLIPEALKANQAALRAASHILLLSKDDPVAMLGCLYVLAGSSKGAAILYPLISRNLGLSPGRGLSYLTRHGEQGAADWDRAAAILDEAVPDPGQIQTMTDAALMLIECIAEAFEALCPLNREAMRYVVTAFNPEAGNHPVPQDKRDLLAVFRASERCLAEYPYFLYRFGTRGRRFADTDGAWLATLPDLGAEPLQAQADWLGRVLSSRGMPRLLLARHLEILAEELAWARPDQAERSALLQQAARRIRSVLEDRLPKLLLRKQVEKLQLACGRPEDFACVEAVDLLASAAMDEAEGLEGSTQSLMAWLADPGRNPAAWIQTVQDILAVLRSTLADEPTL